MSIQDLSLREIVERIYEGADSSSSEKAITKNTEKTAIKNLLLDLPEDSNFRSIAFLAAGQQSAEVGFSLPIDQEFYKHSKRLFWTNLFGVVSGLAADGFNIALNLFFNHYAMNIGMAVATGLDGFSTVCGYWISSKIKNLLNSSMLEMQNRPTITFDAPGKEAILTSASTIINIYNRIHTYMLTHKQTSNNNTTLKEHIKSFLQLKKSMENKISSTKYGGGIGKVMYGISSLSKFAIAGVNIAGKSGLYSRIMSAVSLVSSASSKEVEEINKDSMYADIAMRCARAYILLLRIVYELEDS
jgi:hypothetical protein